MSIPDPLDAGAAREALDYFHAAGFNKVDTAILYQGGKTEVTLGEEKPASKHIIDTVRQCIRLLQARNHFGILPNTKRIGM